MASRRFSGQSRISLLQTREHGRPVQMAAFRHHPAIMHIRYTGLMRTQKFIRGKSCSVAFLSGGNPVFSEA
jgi:hypothetical protein